MYSKVNLLATLGVLCLVFTFIACYPPSSNCSSVPASYEIKLSVEPKGYLFQNGTGSVELKLRSSASFNQTFSMDRIQHDVCYQCSEEFNLTRNNCDLGFWSSMNTTCENLTPASRVATCKRVAFIWYSAINDIPSPYLPVGSPAFCTDDWVGSCIEE